MVVFDGDRTLGLGRFVSSGVLDAVEAVGSSGVRTSSVHCLSHLDEVGLETQDPPLAAKGCTQLQSTHLSQFLTPEGYPDTAERLMGCCCEDTRGLTAYVSGVTRFCGWVV